MSTGQTKDCWRGLAELAPLVRAFGVRRCADSNEVEDLVQDTLLRAMHSRRRGQRPRRLEPWLLRIAANALADRGRRDGRVPCELLEDLDCVAQRDPAHECVGGAGEERWQLGSHVVTKDTALALLREALARLEAEERAWLESHYSATRTGARVVVEAGMDKHRLYRMRRRLGRALEGPLARAASRARHAEGH
ncbi:MAG: hypothetical protein FJ294_06735 [Planctomycetes bacterium]|nr:hypothetical protein [Planctomycetota bacterium]